MLILTVCHHNGVSVSFVICLDLLKLNVMGKTHPYSHCKGAAPHSFTKGTRELCPYRQTPLQECRSQARYQSCRSNGVKNLAESDLFAASERRRLSVMTSIGEKNCSLPPGELVCLHMFSLQCIHGLPHLEE